MHKIYLLLLFFVVLACKDRSPSLPVIPPSIVTKPDLASPKLIGTYQGLFSGDLYYTKDQRLRISVEKKEENRITLKVYSICANQSPITIEATMNTENSFLISEVIINQETLIGEGKFNLDGTIQLDIKKGNLNNFSLKADKIGDAIAIKFDSVSVEGFYPKESFAGDILTIYGKNFDKNGIIKFNNQSAEIVEFSKDSLKVKIPEKTSGELSISYIADNCFSQTSETKFKYRSNQWKPINDLIGTPRWYAISFSDATKGYIGLGMDPNRERLADFWEFDSKDNSWTALPQFPGLPRNAAVTFKIGEKAYMGTGFNSSSLNDFWEFDLQKKVWKEIAPIPSGQREHATSFTLNGKGYVTGGKSAGQGFRKDLWEYDPQTEKWTRKNDLPTIGLAFSTVLYIEDKVLLGGGLDGDGNWHEEWYLYDVKNDSWTLHTKFPTNEPLGFIIDDIGYVLYDDGKQFATYDPKLNKWQKLPVPKELFALHATILTIGDRIFYGTGFNGQYSRSFWEYVR